jgi:hypothetical protein
MEKFLFNPAKDAAYLEMGASRSGIELLAVGGSCTYRGYPGAIRSAIVKALAQSGAGYDRTFEISEAEDHERFRPSYIIKRVR